ncbi:hypothetical protein ACEZ3G_04655 [Maribacter algicola]|uniref:Uncharacterized protein n=1 Tax=Meishania litoralis TaxID=3434685 RepID=A0ACC7LHS7_9FLAO
MRLKLVFLFIGLLLTDVLPDLASVRNQYREASNNEEVAKKLHDELISVTKNDVPVLLAYKGAVTTIMADYAQRIKDKKLFFKEGKELLEHAVQSDPNNVEIRCIRLSVQENAPKITGYHKNMAEDKKFILANYTTMTDNGARLFVKGYVTGSSFFTDSEKQLF